MEEDARLKIVGAISFLREKKMLPSQRSRLPPLGKVHSEENDFYARKLRYSRPPILQDSPTCLQHISSGKQTN